MVVKACMLPGTKPCVSPRHVGTAGHWDQANMGRRGTNLAIAFLHIIAELSAVAGGVQPVLKHVVSIRAVVSSHARLVLHRCTKAVSKAR